ncbi:MAG: peptidoglycan DD-metalloendopeptidase family protein [Pseudomonadota bacterium]
MTPERGAGALAHTRSAQQVNGRPAASVFVAGLMAGTVVASAAWWLSGGLGADVGAIATDLRLARLEADLAAARTAADAAAQRRDIASDALADAHRRLDAADRGRREAEAALAAVSADNETREHAHRALASDLAMQEAEVARLRDRLASADLRRDGIALSGRHLATAIDSVIVERDFAVARLQRVAHDHARLDAALAAATAREDMLLTELETAAATGLAGLEDMFQAADIDLERVIAQMRRDYAGQGGPEERLPGGASGSSDADLRVAALLSDLERVSLLRFAADRVPFTSPVLGGRTTSYYGPRRDPFRGHRAMHQGIDIAAPHGTPILATASGVVTFAGWQRGYGRVIEIRHAFGFETLYAHLSKIRVTVGQRVEAGERIGDMGNTGRSTGTHVHYEVQINGTAVDPMTFIEAARDVL